MATIIPTVHTKDNGTTKVVTWEALVTGSLDGSPVEFTPWGDRTVQVVGTWDTATLDMQGSNDGINWTPLNDVQGDPITLTAGVLVFAIQEIPLYVRPLVSSVGASTDLDVILVMRRANQSRQ